MMTGRAHIGTIVLVSVLAVVSCVPYLVFSQYAGGQCGFYCEYICTTSSGIPVEVCYDDLQGIWAVLTRTPYGCIFQNGFHDYASAVQYAQSYCGQSGGSQPPGGGNQPPGGGNQPGANCPSGWISLGSSWRYCNCVISMQWCPDTGQVRYLVNGEFVYSDADLRSKMNECCGQSPEPCEVVTPEMGPCDRCTVTGYRCFNPDGTSYTEYRTSDGRRFSNAQDAVAHCRQVCSGESGGCTLCDLKKLLEAIKHMLGTFHSDTISRLDTLKSILNSIDSNILAAKNKLESIDSRLYAALNKLDLIKLGIDETNNKLNDIKWIATMINAALNDLKDYIMAEPNYNFEQKYSYLRQIFELRSYTLRNAIDPVGPNYASLVATVDMLSQDTSSVRTQFANYLLVHAHFNYLPFAYYIDNIGLQVSWGFFEAFNFLSEMVTVHHLLPISSFTDPYGRVLFTCVNLDHYIVYYARHCLRIILFLLLVGPWAMKVFEQATSFFGGGSRD